MICVQAHDYRSYRRISVKYGGRDTVTLRFGQPVRMFIQGQREEKVKANIGCCQAEGMISRKAERNIDSDVKFTLLEDGEKEKDSMPRYRQPFWYGLLARTRNVKMTYLLAVITVLVICFWLVLHVWWRRVPQPIVWSDTMRKNILSFPESKLPERIVHFDLKGAPPRVNYFKELFPLLKRAGATGVLIELEDMFPYHGSVLSRVRNGDAYDDKDFKSLLDAAKESGLRIIPLVQTFGHMEWVLKHQQFADVREIRRYPQVICPSNNASFTLVKSIVDDIVKAHDGYIDAIHIGADEAYHVGTECTRCQKRMKELGGLDMLMLEYVSKVARYIKDRYNLRVMVWNDMFDKTDPMVLRSFDMQMLVEPVIWGYAEYLFQPNYFPDGLFDRSAQVFNRLWLGSAFKGANGPDQPYVSLRHYAQNHLSWLQVLNYYGYSLKQSISGIVMTGWQRFDHFAILCELLPSSMPSLIFNLQIVKEGGIRPSLLDVTRDILQCDTSTNWTNDAPEWEALIERFFNQSHLRLRPKPEPPVLGSLRCSFPGSDVYTLIERLRLVKHEYDLFMNSSIRRGWLHEYNLHHQYGSVHHAEITHNVTDALMRHFSDLGNKLQVELAKIYYDDTVTEWLFNNVQIHVDQLRKLSLAAVQIRQTVEFRNRPLSHMKLDL